ncbi:plasmid mobilization protein [Caballeronia sp. LZ065]|uniref:plasmid mobilization protein n=1 Tax=Caballeronia sp. LZ065 TaxID=3038571 RepID=UPI0038572CB2
MSTKPSERIVVFVTPAQKLAISKTADTLGISVSELMRRAVLNFNATSEQIKVAGIVDRLRAPKAPDPLNVALKSVAAKAAAREAREAAANATKRAALPPRVRTEPPAAGATASMAPRTDDTLNEHDSLGAGEDTGEDASLTDDSGSGH